MKTKIIPFDLETAKKIQSGEVEGRIKTGDRNDVRIVCWDRIDEETPVLFLVRFNNWEGVFECNVKGEYIEGCGDDAIERKLVLEVPDNEPQFKPFDKVLVRDDSKDKWVPDIFRYYNDNYPKDYPYRCCANDYKYCIPYEGNEYLVGITDKPKEE